MSQTAFQRHLWSREEYDRMIAAGVFHPEARLELIEGEIINIAPQGSFHATAVQLATDILKKAFSSKFAVRAQLPLAIDESSEPEPDLAVVSGDPRDFRDAHPSTAVLILEIADSTLPFDRQQKKRLYARTGIQEYWILNLVDQQLEVYREPKNDGYLQIKTYKAGESIIALAAPNSNIAITDLLH
jgi:Uma2 family endonuclease